MKANAVKIAEGVYWVGVIHWNSRTFHGYGIPGTTYNAYLVFGEEKNVTSWPLETTTSAPLARVSSTSSTAAALLFTVRAASAPVRRRSEVAELVTQGLTNAEIAQRLKDEL